MPKPQVEAETARLEARIPVQVYDQMQRAAPNHNQLAE